MKLQHLAIIFVIIILPISLVIGEYIQMQIDTITLQKAYSSKLYTATYDAVKAFTLNTINNKYSTVSNSKIRDIEASINTFYSSLGREISVLENTPDNELKQYTPALLYTLYDGYYIYSKYYNQTVGEYEYGLKPYIYYTCRYKAPAKVADGKNSVDIVVNYTLDNYVTIYGTIGNNYITKSGNIIDPEMVTEIEWDGKGDLKSLKYGKTDVVEITREVLKESVIYVNENNQEVRGEYTYIIYNGNKVYCDDGEYFTLNRNKRQKVQGIEQIKELQKYTYEDATGKKVLHSDSALKYYYEAYLFSNWVEQYLGHVEQKDAKDENGQSITDFAVNTGNESIFSSKKLDIRGSASAFDLNRISVIRKSIQTNLLTAIATFDNKSQNAYSYVLPVFSEEDWESITNNISVISFLQGIPIGAKYFNDYCVITNNVNKELVTLDSLYAITADGEVHLTNCRKILDKGLKVNKVYKNIDFERQTAVLSDDNERYYYPHYNTKCYTCLVNIAETYDIDYVIGKVKKYDLQTDNYIEKNDVNLSALHYLREEVLKAYGRECYDLYKVNDYFRGYDETITPNSITNKETDNLETIQYWIKEEHTARVAVKKKDDVEASLKIQYIVSRKNNPINSMTISDNNNWITLENAIQGNFCEIPERLYLGDQVYIRLYDGTYDGDYVRITIEDKQNPYGTYIQIIAGEYRDDTKYYVSDTIKVQVTLGKDDESGVGSLKYLYRVDGNLIQEKTINIEEIIDGKVTFDISEDGEIHIEAITIDLQGNTDIETSYPLFVKKDSVAPEQPTIEIIGNKENDYFNGEVKAKFIFGKDLPKNEKSSASGIDRLYYIIENIEGSNVTKKEGIIKTDGSELVIPEDMKGVIKITAKMVDKAGNESSETTVTISKDNIKPKIITTINASDITTNSFKLNITVQDEHSGIERIIWYYKHNTLDNVYRSVVTACARERTVLQKSVLIQNLISGTYKAYAEVYDVAGNMQKTNEINIQTQTIKVPTSASASPTGWTNKNVTVTLPVETYATQYQVGTLNLNGEWTTYTGPFEVSSNAMVYYRYNDGINKSQYKSILIRNIDKNLPVITTNLSSSTITTKGFTLSIQVEEKVPTDQEIKQFKEESGLGKIVWYYKLNTEANYKSKEEIYTILNGQTEGARGKVTKTTSMDNLIGGTYKVYADVYDVAGNVKKSNEIEIELEGIEIPSGAAISPKGWTNGKVKVTLPTKQGYTTKYKIGTSQLWSNYNEPFEVSSNTTVYYLYNDGINSGNESNISINKIETVAPIIKTQISSSNITKTSFDLSLKVQDTTSGLGKIVWKLDGNASYEPKETVYTTLNGETAGTTSEVTKTQTITVSKAETYNVYAEVYDVAGNKVQTQTITVKMHEHTEACKHYHTGDEKTGTGCYSGGAITQKKCGDAYEQKGYCSWWWDNANNRCIRCHGTDKNKEHVDLICKTCGANTIGNQVHNIDVYSLNCKYKDKASGSYVCVYE